MSHVLTKGIPMKRRQRGVTLIELLIVVVIIGILMSIAYPAYRRYIIRANRTTAKTQLLQIAQALERCYTNSTPYAYNGATCTAAVPLPITSPDGNYVVNNAVAATATTYSLSAVPQGPQAVDAECGTFGLDQTGLQTITGTSTVANCWRK
jgi:type IV pilus assembly protein PilE